MPEATEKREANEKIPKKGGKLDKYKWWIVGGLALVAALVFFFVNRQSSQQGQGQQAGSTPSGIDPATGVPYAQEMGEYGAGGYGFPIGGFGNSGLGATGPAGPAGPAGPKGPRGPRGKAPSPPKPHNHRHRR